jgi:hypothetical protein
MLIAEMADLQAFAHDPTTAPSHFQPEVDEVEGTKRGQEFLVPFASLTLAV